MCGFGLYRANDGFLTFRRKVAIMFEPDDDDESKAEQDREAFEFWKTKWQPKYTYPTTEEWRFKRFQENQRLKEAVAQDPAAKPLPWMTLDTASDAFADLTLYGRFKIESLGFEIDAVRDGDSSYSYSDVEEDFVGSYQVSLEGDDTLVTTRHSTKKGDEYVSVKREGIKKGDANRESAKHVTITRKNTEQGEEYVTVKRQNIGCDETKEEDVAVTVEPVMTKEDDVALTVQPGPGNEEE
ncbi:hypothetical protein QVD17_03737 [Tagetes erecta]|uniref:Uncharacterized protein n=1 Tax=Tagetes erecta TaxID=13708 RepID=A0AAD8LGA6_TARER|nr:hypothetical protein QVD17_03737 [Tagetes erecta]